jgi:hypothetical protein
MVGVVGRCTQHVIHGGLHGVRHNVTCGGYRNAASEKYAA